MPLLSRSRDSAWRQYLLRDGGQEQWLHVPPSTREPMALLQRSSESPGDGQQVTAGGQTFTLVASVIFFRKRNDLPGGLPRLIVYSTGIDCTVVNGQVAYEKGEVTDARAGQVLRS